MENATFTPQTTRQVLETASEAAGVDPRGAELVRMGENAMFRLATVPVIAPKFISESAISPTTTTLVTGERFEFYTQAPTALILRERISTAIGRIAFKTSLEHLGNQQKGVPPGSSRTS